MPIEYGVQGGNFKKPAHRGGDMSSLYGDWGALAFVLAGALVGGFVNGLTGFGTGLTALPLWLQAVGAVGCGPARLRGAPSSAISPRCPPSGSHRLAPACAHADRRLGWRADRHLDAACDRPGRVQARRSAALLIVYCTFMLLAAGRVTPVGRRARRGGGQSAWPAACWAALQASSGRLAHGLGRAEGLAQGRAAHRLPGFQHDDPVGHAGGEPGAGPDRSALPGGARRGAARHADWRVPGIACSITASTTAASTASCSRCCLCRGSGSSGRTAEHLSYFRSLGGRERPSKSAAPDEERRMPDASRALRVLAAA